MFCLRLVQLCILISDLGRMPPHGHGSWGTWGTLSGGER